jgi:hypothetical protein
MGIPFVTSKKNAKNQYPAMQGTSVIAMSINKHLYYGLGETRAKPPVMG